MKNLLFLHAHDAGRHLSPYGYRVATPNLDALAAGGVVMRDAHCAAPTCSPSRAAMWTGLTAHETGMLGLVHRGFDLSDRSRHLMAHLGASGYHTALVGIQHEFNPSPESGALVYREHLAVEPRPLEIRDFHAAERAAAFVFSPPRGPWALSAGFFYPHREFLSAATGAAATVKVPDILPDRPEVRLDYARYAASVAEMDRCVGVILKSLADSGRAADTVVVFTTDHGIAFPEMKGNLTAHGTGVGLILRAPGDLPAGRASDALVSHLDLPATLCELLGAPPPAPGHGRSFADLLRNGGDAFREDVFAEVNTHASAEPMRGVRTKRFNLIVRFDGDLSRAWANVDNGPSKDLWMRLHADAPRERVQLFDLERDPLERRNVADEPAYASARAEMESRLRGWMTQTRDPLLDGPLLLPDDAKLNPRACTDPGSKNFLPVQPS